MAIVASYPNPIISKDILRSEVRRKQTKKANWRVSTEWSAKSGVQRESAERQVQTGNYKVECKKWSAKGKCRKASADREPTTHLNTLGGQRPRADLIAYAHSAWPGFRVASFANFYQNRTKMIPKSTTNGTDWARGGRKGQPKINTNLKKYKKRKRKEPK